jgi:lipoate-protein ligase A
MHRGRVGVELWFNLLVNSVSALNVYRSAGPPLEDLAREAWLLDRAANGAVSLLLTSWKGPVVVLGYAQKPEEADLDWCRANGIPVLRRLTGGTGVIHKGDLGVGLFLPGEHPWAKGVVGLYGRFLDALGPALRSLGSEAARPEERSRASRVRSPVCFLDQLSDTLVVDGGKAVGCAQTRRRGAVLIHAAILLGLEAELYARVFDVAEGEVRSGLAPALPGADWRVVGDAIVVGLRDALGMKVRDRPLMPVPDPYLEPYTTARWSPVLPEGGQLESQIPNS